jgi:hypothetical protein
MSNPEVTLTLDEAVADVLGILTGLDLTYDPELDRYRAITRQLNRALKANALEYDWTWYSAVLSLGTASEGVQELILPTQSRARVRNDDSVRLVDDEGRGWVWAYFLPADSLHKYSGRTGLWCAITRRTLRFSRPFTAREAGLDVQVPVMREPKVFRLPEPGKDVSDVIRVQPIDFNFPDVIVARAAYFYAQTDPVMQPRVQTLESEYKNMMYQLIERDTFHTDSPYVNDFILPVESGLRPAYPWYHDHPHA